METPDDLDDPDYWYDSHDHEADLIELFVERICKFCDFWQENDCAIINRRYYQFNGCFEFDNMDYSYWNDQLYPDIDMKEGDHE